MGTELFGVNISGLIHQHVSPGIPKARLIKTARRPNPAKLTGKPLITEESHDCSAFADSFKQREITSDILVSDRKIVLIGDSLPSGVTPDKDDSVFIESENKTFEILEILERDPASATWTLHGRE